MFAVWIHASDPCRAEGAWDACWDAPYPYSCTAQWSTVHRTLRTQQYTRGWFLEKCLGVMKSLCRDILCSCGVIEAPNSFLLSIHRRDELTQFRRRDDRYCAFASGEIRRSCRLSRLISHSASWGRRIAGVTGSISIA